ncbi:hypothetical protein L7F22_052072 [Adiantum nelumboides]|nr:hypothetical protein [Adiantum nelumboides]
MYRVVASSSIDASVVFSTTAIVAAVVRTSKHAWDILAGLYASRNEAKFSYLCKELESKIMRKDDDMNIFLAEIKVLQEQLILQKSYSRSFSCLHTILDALLELYQRTDLMLRYDTLVSKLAEVSRSGSGRSFGGTLSVLFSVTGFGFDLANWFRIFGSGLWLVSGQDWLLASAGSGLWLVSGSGSGLVSAGSGQDWLLVSAGSGPSAGTQGSATQDPHIAASDSSSDFDIMEGYLTQQHPESSSQDMHALGQQPGVSMFSRLKETLSRATRSEHATNEINEGGREVDSPFTSQIDPVLSESVHVSTPTTTPIGLSKLTPSETLLLDGRSLAEVQEVECYILAAREKEIESLRKAEQRRATLAKAPMTSANPLQSPELTTLKSQPIGSHIASGSKDTSNTSILDGVFLNENWEYNLQTEKLTDLYTSYTYHVGWLDVIQATSNSTSVDEQQRMICDVIHSIVQMERQNLGINMPSMGPMRFLDTTKAKQLTISQMETPSVSPMDPLYIVLLAVSMQSEPTHGSFSFPDLVQPSLGDLPTPIMNMTGGAPSTLLADTTPLHTSVAPLPIPIGVHQPYVPVATHPYVAPMPPPNPTAYVPQSHYPSPYFSGTVPAGINTSYPTNMATSNASSSISIEERYPFSLSQLCRLCYPVISLEWDHIEQLAREKNLDELEWLIRLLITSDPYPVEDMHPIPQIYPLAQIDYTRLVRFLVLLCEEDDEDIEDDWTDMSHGMTDNDFIYLDDEDRVLTLGLPFNLYNILFS